MIPKCNCSAPKRGSYYHDQSCTIEKYYDAIEKRRQRKHNDKIRASERHKLLWCPSHPKNPLIFCEECGEKEAYAKGQADLIEKLKATEAYKAIGNSEKKPSQERTANYMVDMFYFIEKVASESAFPASFVKEAGAQESETKKKGDKCG
jgi:hypothetical protein